MTLNDPLALVLLILAPVVAVVILRPRQRANLRFSTLRDVGLVGKSWRIRGRWLLVGARVLCIALLIVALARPQMGNKQSKRFTRGVVMELVVDRSSSMSEPMDYQGRRLPRLEVVKRVLTDFINGGNGLSGRENDLIGLVTFAGFADTVCPLVLTHDILAGFLKETKTAQTRAEDGTSIGQGLKLAAARLYDAEKEIARHQLDADADEVRADFEIQSKVIVLLTDGKNTDQDNPPLEAVELAREWGIKIYTIGIGSGRTQAPRGFFSLGRGPDLDEPLLKAIAERTGAFYSRADDAGALVSICDKIDQQEKTEIKAVEYSSYEERFIPYAVAALIFLALEMTLATTVFRKIP